MSWFRKNGGDKGGESCCSNASRFEAEVRLPRENNRSHNRMKSDNGLHPNTSSMLYLLIVHLKSSPLSICKVAVDGALCCKGQKPMMSNKKAMINPDQQLLAETPAASPISSISGLTFIAQLQ